MASWRKRYRKKKRRNSAKIQSKMEWRRIHSPTFDHNGIPVTHKIDTSLGFKVVTSFAFDVSLRFTQETWHGRMKATRGLARLALLAEHVSLT
jgi:hypothetical protein